MSYDKNKPQGIDACYEQIKRQKEDRKKEDKEQFDKALKEIRECCGVKEIGAYTLQDAIYFLCQKYNAREISLEECKDYVVIDFRYEEEEFISMLTEGYISDGSCKILLLPAKYQGKIQGDVKKNGAVLFLNYENDKVDYWDLQGNSAGYSYKDLLIELDIFKAKEQGTFPNKKQRAEQDKLEKWNNGRVYNIELNIFSKKAERMLIGQTKSKNKNKKERFWEANKPK